MHDTAQVVRSAEELFSLPALAYLRAARGERVALVCRGIGGLIPVVEALGGQLVWFFTDDERSVDEVVQSAVPFDLVVEYRPNRPQAGR
jgi:hypothetical protein